MIDVHSEPGFILVDAALNPIAFNAGALKILAFPENVERIQHPSLFVLDKVRGWLVNKVDPEKSQFVRFYKSGNRRYTCRAFHLGSERSRSSDWIALLLERYSSNVSAVSELSQRFDLTVREREVVEFLLQGMTSKEIANRMNISPNTVKAFLRLVMVKMSVSTRSGIVGKMMTSQ